MASGGAQNDLLFFALFVVAIFILWIVQGGAATHPTNDTVLLNTNIRSDSTSQSSEDSDNISGYPHTATAATSSWSGLIHLDAGSAFYEDQSNREYVVIKADDNNKQSVDVTGWILESRPHRTNQYTSSNRVSFLAPVRIAVPKAAAMLYPSGLSALTDVILRPGDEAMVVSGSIPTVSSSLLNKSFRTNTCTGYFEMQDYNFSPSLPVMCPDNDTEVNFSYLDETCRTFIRNMGTCHEPKFEAQNVDDYWDESYVDGRNDLTSQCRDFLRAHYNYQSCFTNHAGEANFLGSEWRLFLGRPWQLWDDKDETITLYDQYGRIVDQVSSYQ